jgi:hypothetical protein
MRGIHPIKMKAVHAFTASGTDNHASEHNNSAGVGNIRFINFTKTVFKWLAIMLQILEVLNLNKFI